MHTINPQEIEADLESLGGIIKISPIDGFSDIQDFSLRSSELENMLHKYGALLFRGFSIDSPDKFKKVAISFAEDLMSDNGEHNPLSTTDGVYTPVSYSPKEKLLWHNENSFNHTWPMMIMFGALKPADTGGETPVVDSRKVLAALAPEIVAEFSQKGIMYTRTHGFGFGRSWQETYRTENISEMEKKCKEHNIQAEWFGQDQVVTKQVRPAIVKHPVTGEFSWFNQAQHWHPSCLKAEVQDSLKKIFPPDKLPRNCYFGDGSLISDDIMQHICDVYQRLEISFAWEKGDVMVLDNVLFAHARNAYSGERKLLVTMGKHAAFSGSIRSEVY